LIVEITNEFALLIQLYTFLILADETVDKQIRFKVGYVSIGNLIFNVCFNFSTLAYSNSIELIERRRKFKIRSKILENEREKYESKKELVKQFPDQFTISENYLIRKE